MHIIVQGGYIRLDDPTFQDIYNEGNEQLVCRIYSYQKSFTKSVFYHAFAILFATIPYFIFNTYPKMRCQLKYKKCSIHNAQLFLGKFSFNSKPSGFVIMLQIYFSKGQP